MTRRSLYAASVTADALSGVLLTGVFNRWGASQYGSVAAWVGAGPVIDGEDHRGWLLRQRSRQTRHPTRTATSTVWSRPDKDRLPTLPTKHEHHRPAPIHHPNHRRSPARPHQPRHPARRADRPVGAEGRAARRHRGRGRAAISMLATPRLLAMPSHRHKHQRIWIADKPQTATPYRIPVQVLLHYWYDSSDDERGPGSSQPNRCAL